MAENLNIGTMTVYQLQDAKKDLEKELNEVVERFVKNCGIGVSVHISQQIDKTPNYKDGGTTFVNKIFVGLEI